MLKVLICCGNGMGSSAMMMLNIDTILNELGVEYSEYHDSVGNVQPYVNDYDVLICSRQFEPIFKPLVSSCYLMTLANVASKKELREKMKAYLEEHPVH